MLDGDFDKQVLEASSWTLQDLESLDPIEISVSTSQKPAELSSIDSSKDKPTSKSSNSIRKQEKEPETDKSPQGADTKDAKSNTESPPPAAAVSSTTTTTSTAASSSMTTTTSTATSSSMTTTSTAASSSTATTSSSSSLSGKQPTSSEPSIDDDSDDGEKTEGSDGEPVQDVSTAPRKPLPPKPSSPRTQRVAELSRDVPGVVTRSMARKLEDTARSAVPDRHESTRDQPKPSTPARRTQPPPPPLPPASVMRRAPQFYYDRFIPARTPASDPVDLRAHDNGQTPVRRPIDYSRVHTESAGRTYDAILRSELFDGRRVASRQQPPVARATARPTSPPSLVPWSSERTTASSPRTILQFRSSRLPVQFAKPQQQQQRNLFAQPSPAHPVYAASQLRAESQHILRTSHGIRRPGDPLKVLDAPGIIDDYYLNLLDWSTHNQIAVALGNHAYLWDAHTSHVTCVASLDASRWLTAVKWSAQCRLALGTNTGGLEIWDPQTARKTHSLSPRRKRRVSSVSWLSPFVVSAGGKDKRVFTHDTRMSSSIVAVYKGHSNEVCGLAWDPFDGVRLASGGNDNTVCVWDTRFAPITPVPPPREVAEFVAPVPRVSTQPLFSLTAHRAAVKAVAWSPRRRGVLATGGGTDDRCIRVWSAVANRAAEIECIDTGSQVCNLAWSSDGSELVSTHGYSQNNIVLWNSAPELMPTCVIGSHAKRVLYFAMSPDCRIAVTAAADETLRFWNVFGGRDVDLSVAGIGQLRTVRLTDGAVLADDSNSILYGDVPYIR